VINCALDDSFKFLVEAGFCLGLTQHPVHWTVSVKWPEGEVEHLQTFSVKVRNYIKFCHDDTYRSW